MSKVSVIIPLFNREALIEGTLVSIENQTITPCEVLIIDDSSTDNSLSVVNNYCVNSKLKIKIFKNERKKGVSGARNTGILNSKGDILAFLDSDDLWERNYIERILEVFKYNRKIDVVFTSFEFFGCFSDTLAQEKAFCVSRNNMLARSFVQTTPELYLSNDKIFECFLRYGFPFRVVSSAVSRRFLMKQELLFHEEIGYTEEGHFFTLASRTAVIAYATFLGARIRRHPENSAVDFYNDKIRPSFRIQAVSYLNLLNDRDLILTVRQRHALRYAINEREYFLLQSANLNKTFIFRFKSAFIYLLKSFEWFRLKTAIKFMIRG